MHALEIEQRAPAAPRGLAGPTRRSGMAESWTATIAGVATRTAARIAAAVGAELRIRRDTRQLMAMSDYMLKDIGLTRADIARAVREGRD